ncbi:Molybdenum cofactor sulfurase [Linum grandiflorum]
MRKTGDSATTCHCGICRIPCRRSAKFVTSNDPSPAAAAFRSEFEASMAMAHFTNHESLPSLNESFTKFTESFPRYLETKEADRIRAEEYSHLSVSNHVCLDYVGNGLFSSRRQQKIKIHPSVASTSSTESTEAENPFFELSHKSVISLKSEIQHGIPESEFGSRLKNRVMSFMNISDEEYGVVYTANESSAFKLLADCYPFETNRNLLTVYDHENDAVEAMAKSAQKKGARVSSAEFTWPELKIQTEKLQRKITRKKRKQSGLFVFPAKSRVTGARYSYLWMNSARENGWHVLLDASALVPKEMETLGLSLFEPDFIICSFFKVFGENPSGFACLIVRKSIAALTNSDLKPSSIVELNSSSNSEFEFRGLDHADQLGLIVISYRLRLLMNWLVNSLLQLRHPSSSSGGVDGNNNNVPLVMVYGPGVEFDRGTAVGFNVFDWRGEMVDPAMVQKLAGRSGISVGCGCLKNVAAAEKEEDGGGGVKMVTAAIGLVTDFEDVYRVWGFVARFLDADFVEKESKLTILDLEDVTLPNSFYDHFLPLCPLLEELRIVDYNPYEKKPVFAAPSLRLLFFLSDFEYICFELTPRLSVLTILDAGRACFENHDPVMVALFAGLPGLEELNIGIRLLKQYDLDSNPIHSLQKLFEPGDQLEVCCLQKLEELNIEISLGTRVEMDWVRFVLATASELKRVFIKLWNDDNIMNLPLWLSFLLGQHLVFIDAPFISEVNDVPYQLPATLNNLKVLRFPCILLGRMKEARVLACLIRSSPNLKKLTIVHDEDDRYRKSDDTVSLQKLLEPEDKRGVCCLQRLEEFEIQNSRGNRVELELVRFALANATLLKRITIKPNIDLSSDTMLKFVVEVKQYRRVSKEEGFEYVLMNFEEA